MKNFIIMSIMIIFLLFFPLQFVVNQVNHYRMSTINNIVHTSVQKARTDGYFTQDNIDNMTNKILEVFPKLNLGDIYIEVTTTPKYRVNVFDERELIEYKVTVPINKILAMPGFFNITDEENKLNYTIQGTAPSELLMP